MHKFTENIKTDVGRISTATCTSYTSTGTSVDMAKYNNFVGLIGGAVASATYGMTAYIAQSTDAGTWATTNYVATLTIASSTTPAMGIGWFGAIECRAEQMSDGYRYLRVECVATGAVIGYNLSIANVRFNSRYPSNSLPA